MPSPQFVPQGKPDTGVTNIRNVTSPHWCRWLRPESRRVVPRTTFCEWEDTNHEKRNVGSRSVRMRLSHSSPAFGRIGMVLVVQ